MNVDIVDTEQRIQRFLRHPDELITDGLVIIDEVHVVRYVGRPGNTRR